MSTKRQINPTSRVSILASQAVENSRFPEPYQWIQTYNRNSVSSILTNLMSLQEKQQKKSSIVGSTIEAAKQPSSSNKFQMSKLTHTTINSKINLGLGLLDFYKLKTKIMSLIH